ncbi:hypothetical protein ACFYW9_38310 [Streptomyces sp. NPDC002698]|uniref:hypothetical protein n=1 Tax=Streptomyces sp. NPDC002698 TaxID=3364660 RepID=UPI0036955A25
MRIQSVSTAASASVARSQATSSSHKQPEPPQHPKPIAAGRQRAAVTQRQVAQVRGDRLDVRPVTVEDRVGRMGLAGFHHGTHTRQLGPTLHEFVTQIHFTLLDRSDQHGDQRGEEGADNGAVLGVGGDAERSEGGKGN